MSGVLEVEALESGYGKLPVLHGVSLRCEPDELVAVVGPNGAGKSTLMKTLFRLLPIMSGRIVYDGRDLSSVSTGQLAELGMALAPQGSNTFPDLSVEDNLQVALVGRKRQVANAALARIYEEFPVLAQRRTQRAKTLSGGERQMLALAGATIVEPRFLALDEPTTGLAPAIVDQLIDRILRFRRAGATILWVIEENPLQVLHHIDRVYLLQAGQITREVPAKQLLEDEGLQKLFFGTEGSDAEASPDASHGAPRDERGAMTTRRGHR